MRIVSWNVNGVKALQKSTKGGLKSVFDALGADIICLQETKLTRETIEESIAVVPGFDAFFSVSRSKAYSGVATYCKSGFVPTDALDGVSGVLPAHYGSQVGSRLWQPPESLESCSSLDISLEDLDAEGRCVATDHGAFVLFNVYFPRACAEEPDRWAYKKAYNLLIETRVRQLVAAGRIAIVAGDVNICHRPIDHCDPGKWEREWEKPFSDHYMRKWLTSFLIEGGGPMVDSLRLIHPSKTGVYTCWAQLTGARATNYGTRIDYILVSAAARGSCRDAGSMPDVLGSDHCPVWADLDSEALPAFTAPARPPPLCAQYIFAARQDRLTRFVSTRADTHICTAAAGLEQKGGVAANGGTRMKSPAGTTANGKTRHPAMQKRAMEESAQIGPRTKRSGGDAPAPALTIHAFFGPSTKRGKHASAEELSPIPGPPATTSANEQAHATNHTNEDAVATQSAANASATVSSLSNHTSISGANQSTNAGQATHAIASAAREWRDLLKGNRLPLCSGHGKRCVERLVKKEGENCGRVFYCCALPEGRQEDPSSRCKFFIWREDHVRYMGEGVSLDYSIHPKYKHQRNKKGALPALDT